MKTKEELNALKEKVEILNNKLAELSEEELAEVTGGLSYSPCLDCGIVEYKYCKRPEKNTLKDCIICKTVNRQKSSQIIC